MDKKQIAEITELSYQYSRCWHEAGKTWEQIGAAMRAVTLLMAATDLSFEICIRRVNAEIL